MDVNAVDVHTVELDLPVRVRGAEVEDFIEYVTKKLRSLVPKEAKSLFDLPVIRLEGGVDWATFGIKESREESEEVSLRTIEFSYHSTQRPFSIRANNMIIILKKDGEVYTTKLLTQGNSKAIEKAASVVRKILMEWSVERGKIEGK